MELKEMIAKAQRLRRQHTELQDKAEQIQHELEQLNTRLRKALEDDGRAVSELSEADFQMVLAEFNDPKRITVEVVYATRDKQRVEEIQLSQGATIEDGIMVSGILEHFPELDLGNCTVGIHGKIKPLGQALQEGDRVEIYRPVEAGGA